MSLKCITPVYFSDVLLGASIACLTCIPWFLRCIPLVHYCIPSVHPPCVSMKSSNIFPLCILLFIWCIPPVYTWFPAIHSANVFLDSFVVFRCGIGAPGRSASRTSPPIRTRTVCEQRRGKLVLEAKNPCEGGPRPPPSPPFLNHTNLHSSMKKATHETRPSMPRTPRTERKPNAPRALGGRVSRVACF